MTPQEESRHEWVGGEVQHIEEPVVNRDAKGAEEKAGKNVYKIYRTGLSDSNRNRWNVASRSAIPKIVTRDNANVCCEESMVSDKRRLKCWNLKEMRVHFGCFVDFHFLQIWSVI
jgi:hypothetical protein